MIPAPATPNQVKRLLAGKGPQEYFLVTPSQIDEFLTCERAAGLKHGDGYREESQIPDGCITSAALGDVIHGLLEAYVKTGAKPDLLQTVKVGGYYDGRPWERTVYPGQIADAAICLIPPGAVAESELRLTRPNGITWTGRRDLRIAQGPRAEVRDYKTTSDFKYMDEKDLATDVQGTVYAWAECEEHPDTQVVHLHWQFLRTKGKPDSKSLRRDVPRAEAFERMARLDVVAERWVGLRKKIALGVLRGADLEPTGIETGACDKFTGCVHRGTRCILTPEQTLKSFKGGFVEKSIADKLAEMAQKQTAMGNVPPPIAFAGIPAPAPAPAPVQTTRPSFWMPGDPMNEDQAYFHSKGKPLSYIANLAENPPPPDVSATYDKAVQAPVENGFVNGPAPGAPTLAAINPTAAGAFVNGVPAPAPEGAQVVPQLDRNALKAEAVRRGLVTSSSRMGAEGLLKLLQTGAKEVEAPAQFHTADHAPALAQTIPAPAPVAYAQAFVPAAPESVPYPAPSAIPAPAGARFDDATLDAIADRVVARLKAALLGAL